MSRYDSNGNSVAPQPITPGYVAKWVAVGVAGLVVLILLLSGCDAAKQSYDRYQSRQNRNQTRQQAIYDANNKTLINKIVIAQQAQNVKVAEQQAQIRFENAVGIRKAQDEISSTLTPLYVQFEMVQTLSDIAKSGRNNSVVFIPTGPDGRPVAAPQINSLNPSGGSTSGSP